jgi:hypothetical protein
MVEPTLQLAYDLARASRARTIKYKNMKARELVRTFKQWESDCESRGYTHWTARSKNREWVMILTRGLYK